MAGMANLEVKTDLEVKTVVTRLLLGEHGEWFKAQAKGDILAGVVQMQF